MRIPPSWEASLTRGWRPLQLSDAGTVASSGAAPWSVLCYALGHSVVYNKTPWPFAII